MIGATLFSGIGAPEMAMPHWRWPWHAEIEKFPSAVMAARHPQSVNLGDVIADDFTERAAQIARPNVLIFGSPCQSYSIAGKRLGMDDPRGNLALTALGIVDRLKPDWFVFENVPGLFSSWSGEEVGPLQTDAEWDSEENSDFVTFLSLVDELGYSGAWTVLDAQYRGVAQRRNRVFFVGHIGDWRAPAAVLLEPESLRGHSPPSRKAGEDVTGTLSARSEGGGGLGTDFDLGGGIVEVAMCLNAGGQGRQDFETETLIPIRHGGFFDDRVAHALRGEGFDASEDGTGRGTPLVAFDTTQITSKANRSYPKPGDPCHPLAAKGHPPAIAVALRGRDDGATAELGDDKAFTLRSGGGGGDKPHVLAFDCKSSGQNGFGVGEIASTMRAMGHAGSHANAGGHQAALTQGGVRRLTPRECERLQGFPDDHTLIEYRGKPAADGPRYKACGNSMAVPVMRFILSRIEAYERDVRPMIEASA